MDDAEAYDLLVGTNLLLVHQKGASEIDSTITDELEQIVVVR